MSSSNNPSSVRAKERNYPKASSTPDSEKSLLGDMPEMTIVMARKPFTSESQSTGSKKEFCPPTSSNTEQQNKTILEIERELAQNPRLRFYTNNPWMTVDKEVHSVFNELNSLCSLPMTEDDLDIHLKRVVDSRTQNDLSTPVPHFLVAKQTDADEWVKKGLISELSDARRKLPLDAKKMFSNNPWIAVGVKEERLQMFTNKDPTDLCNTKQSSLVKDLLTQYPNEENGYQVIDPQTMATNMLSKGSNHAPYSVIRVDESVLKAFGSGYCANITPLTEADLKSAQSCHLQSTGWRSKAKERVKAWQSKLGSSSRGKGGSPHASKSGA